MSIVRRGGATFEKLTKKWCESKKWTPGWLKENMPESTILTVKKSKKRFFMYAETPHPRYLFDKDQKAYDFLAMNTQDFFHVLENDKENFYYHTAELSQQAPFLLDNAPGWESLVSSEKPHGELSMWIGGENTSTQCHYDVYDNTFVQMYGKKTFTIFPPSQYNNLHVFPDAHPRARKSQIDFDFINTNQKNVDNGNTNVISNAGDCFSFFSKEKMEKEKTVFELVPGDVLLIPAFWFHHVEANQISISLNIFSESTSRPIADRIFAKPLPFDSEWPGMVLLLCYRMLVQELLQSLKLHPHKFLADIVRSRYRPLIGEEMEVEDFALLSTPWPWDKIDQVITETQAKALFTPFVRNLVKDFMLLRRQDEGICQIVLAHVLEMWGLKCVGSEDLPRFFRYVLHPSLLR